MNGDGESFTQASLNLPFCLWSYEIIYRIGREMELIGRSILNVQPVRRTNVYSIPIFCARTQVTKIAEGEGHFCVVRPN
jgi:hypothetical protein